MPKHKRPFIRQNESYTKKCASKSVQKENTVQYVYNTFWTVKVILRHINLKFLYFFIQACTADA